MNSQDKADLKKYQELKEQRRIASKKYNLANIDEIKIKRLQKNQIKKATEAKDPEPSLIKLKPDKPKEPVKTNPIKPVKANLSEVINYKAILFKPKKIKPLKIQKKMQKDDLIFT